MGNQLEVRSGEYVPRTVKARGDGRSHTTVILIAATSAIVVAIIGALAVRADVIQIDPRGDRRSESLKDQLADLTVTASSLATENEGLKGNNQVGSDPSGATTSPSVTPPPSVPGQSIRRGTGGTALTFAWGYAADLDSDDADWGVRQGFPAGSELSLSTSDGQLLSAGPVTLFDHRPTQLECENAAVHQPRLEPNDTRVGLMFCLRTSEDLLAFVRVVTTDDDRKVTSLEIIVWN